MVSGLSFLSLCESVADGSLGVRAAKNRLKKPSLGLSAPRNRKATGQPSGRPRTGRVDRVEEWMQLASKPELSIEEKIRQAELLKLISKPTDLGTDESYRRSSVDGRRGIRVKCEVIPQLPSMEYKQWKTRKLRKGENSCELPKVALRFIHPDYSPETTNYNLPPQSRTIAPVTLERQSGELTKQAGELYSSKLLWGSQPVSYPVADEQSARSKENLLHLVKLGLLSPNEANTLYLATK